MKRKIVLLSPHVSPLAQPGEEGSGARMAYLTRVACELAWMGIQVEVFTCETGRELWEVCDGRENIRVIHVPFASGASQAERFQDLREYLQDSVSQEHTPDLVHATSWSSGWVAAELKTELGIPFVMSYEACAGENFEHDQRVVRLADAILVNSARERENVLEWYDADPTYIVEMQQDSDIEISPGEICTPPAEPFWQSHGRRLAALYEEVLAIRRVMIPSLRIPVLAAGQYGYQNEPQALETGRFALETTAAPTALQIPVP